MNKINDLDNVKGNISKYIKEIKIGNVNIKNNIFLAPMAGITDLPFRGICKKYGPGLMCTEMVSAKGLVYEDIKTNKMLTLLEDERPSAVQIFGSDPEDIRRAIEKLNKVDNIDIIDINMGCPAPKVTKNGDGAALLKDLDLVRRIIKVAVEVSIKPITIKTRIGYGKDDVTAIEIAKMASELGASAITIHGRTKADLYTGKANLDIIRKVKEASAIPVIGNGDVVDLDSAINMFEKTNVDGIMIARGAMGNPWIFREIIQGKKEVTLKEKLEIILEHIDMAVEYYGEKRAVPELRKHIAWYLKGLKASSKVKDEINSELSSKRVKKMLILYFDELEKNENDVKYLKNENNIKE